MQRFIAILFVLAAACGDDASPTRDAGPDHDAGRTDAGRDVDSGGSEGDAGMRMPGPGCPSDIASDNEIHQALPRIDDLDTAYPTQTGTTIPVAAGGDLQAAIDMAMPGDTIELAAGATFTGPFHLREKSGDGWIVIRTATPDAMLPPPGTRITPSASALMPKLVVGAGEG